MSLRNEIAARKQSVAEMKPASLWKPEGIDDLVYGQVLDLKYQANSKHHISDKCSTILLKDYEGDEVFIYRNFYIDAAFQEEGIQIGDKVCVVYLGKQKNKFREYNSYTAIKLSEDQWNDGPEELKNDIV